MRANIRKTAWVLLTLCAGLGGGGAFALLGLPMPWLLGAIAGAAAAAAAVGDLPVGLSRWLRNAVLVVLGLLIGSTIHADTLAQAVHWPVSMAAVALYVAVCTASLYGFLRRFAGFDPVTAYFASSPGGFMAMTVIGGAMGGRERSIALTHAIRVVLVVFTIVLSYHLLLGIHAPPSATATAAAPALSPGQILLLVLTGATGWGLENCFGFRRAPCSDR